MPTSRKFVIRMKVCNSRKVSNISSSKNNINIRNTSNNRDASEIRDTSNSGAPPIEKTKVATAKTSFGNTDDASNSMDACSSINISNNGSIGTVSKQQQ